MMSTDPFHIDKLAILGPGLLGGSLALAAKRRGLAGRVALWGRRQCVLDEADALGMADLSSTDPGPIVQDADLIVLCTPIGVMADLAGRFRPFLKAGAIVTDVGSVKSIVVSELGAVLAGSHGIFIGSHPMAGSEQSGLGAAREDLFEQAVCIVTPDTNTPAEAVRAAERFWQRTGARVHFLSPEEHDRTVALVSHLPHAVAAGLADFVCSESPHSVKYSGTGLRDTTRVASGPVDMWREILSTNRQPVGRALRGLIARLEGLAGSLESGDDEALLQLLENAKRQRDELIVKKSHV